MSDDSNAPADLSSIGIDLSEIFRPAWTVESSDSTARLAAKFDEGDRPERHDRQGGNRRREGQGGSRDRDARGPRPQFGGRDKKAGSPGSPGQGGQGGPRRDQAGRGPDSRDRRDEGRNDRRSEPPAKPCLEGWKITLLPEPAALEGIAKQIRSRAKTYPLFELARLIIQLSDRYSIQLKAESETSPELFRVTADGSLWTSRREAISHLLSKHLGKFYRRSSITVEAPKGSYSVVAQCGMSGILLGPPNHHEYQSRLLALHSTRFKNLPFEVYKTRIKMMRDDALMEQWKSEQSTRTVYIPIDPGSEIAASTEAPPVTEESIAPDDVAGEVVEVGRLRLEVVASTDRLVERVRVEAIVPTDEIASEIPAEEARPVSEEASASEDNPTEADAEEESIPAAAETPLAEEGGLSLEEATAHFHTHHAAAAVETVEKEITLSGRVALHESDPLLRELLLRTLQELDRFPLPLAQVLGKELTGSGLQIFKAQKKIHVSVARPRYLDQATTPTSEGFRKILDYLEAHPNQHRDKQWSGLLAQITEPAGDEPEAVQRREQALGTDLLWLLHQGHILDFAMGNLQAAMRPIPKPTPAVKAQESQNDATPVKSASEEASPELEAGETLEAMEAVEIAEAPELIHSNESIEPPESTETPKKSSGEISSEVPAAPTAVE